MIHNKDCDVEVLLSNFLVFNNFLTITTKVLINYGGISQ